MFVKNLSGLAEFSPQKMGKVDIARGAKLFAGFNDNHYHQPSDEYHEDWDFSGMEQYARFGFLIGVDIANTLKLPTWRPGDEFLPARVASGVK